MIKFRGSHSIFSVDQIQKLEEKLGVGLPESYYKFLMEQGSGEVYYNSYDRNIKIDDKDHKVYECIDEILNTDQIIEYWTSWNEYELFTEAQVIPFASSLGPTFVSIGYAGENLGKIYVVDFDFGSTLQADTLEKFLLQIRYDDPDSVDIMKI